MKLSVLRGRTVVCLALVVACVAPVGVVSASAREVARPAVPASIRPAERSCYDKVGLAAMALGPNRQFLEWKAKADRCKDYDWTSDCPSSKWWNPRFDLFWKACEQFQFGYRNYGPRGKAYSPFEETRKLVDDKFLANMRDACFKWFGPLARITCLRRAHDIYDYVRAHLGPWK